MGFFLFIIISFSFMAFVAAAVHFSVFKKRNHPASPPTLSQDRRADWLLFLNPRTEPGIFVRNLKTNEKVFLPSPKHVNKEKISPAWILALFSATVVLGCLAGFILYKVWDFILHSWF